MKIRYVFVGKTQFPEIDKMVRRYVDRLNHFVKTEIRIIKEEKITRSKTDEDIVNAEAERIIKCIDSAGFVVVWDIRGKMLSSAEYAKLIEKWELDGRGIIWMVIGGAVGLGHKVLERANEILSLSPMTFPHDLARLIVVEQTYRAFTINRNIPYHR